jgi:hypothetical protein
MMIYFSVLTIYYTIFMTINEKLKLLVELNLMNFSCYINMLFSHLIISYVIVTNTKSIE